MDAYMTTEPWSDFGTFVALEDGEGTTPCAKPTVTYADGKLQFDCETEGADIYYTLSAPDVKESNTHVGEGNAVALDAYYDITFYAIATGYNQSETVKARLYWLASSGSLDDIAANTVKKRGVTVQTNGGFVTISGLDNGEQVRFFGVDGKMLGEARATDGAACFAATRGSVVIVKIGNDTVKIAVE